MTAHNRSKHPKLAYVIRMTQRYVEAAAELRNRGEKINAYTLGEQLGRDSTSVYRFLRRHPIAAAHVMRFRLTV